MTTTLSRPQAHDLVRRQIAVKMPFWVFTAALAIIFLYPLIWTAVSSVSPLAGTNQTDGWGFGNYATLGNYQDGILQYIANSALVSGLTVALTLFISLLGGYAFARFRFPGKNVLFLSTIAILMVPYATLLIPLYVLLNVVGLSNSLVGVALGAHDVPAPVLHLHDAHLLRVHPEASSTRRRWSTGAPRGPCCGRVLVPAVKPGLITVGLFAFLAAWNDFIALRSSSSTTRRRMTLPLAISNLRGQVQGVVDYGATEAGVVVLALPCILLFLILQRHYVRGFMSGAFKG